MQPETADRWLDAWVLEATGRDLPRNGRCWDAAWGWIAAERKARRPGGEDAPVGPGSTAASSGNARSATIPRPGPQERAKRHEHGGGQ
jgi:hypothetical protein